MAEQALTVARIDSAKPNPEKPVYLSDERGLYLEIKSQGSKGWRFRYKLAGKPRLMSFGAYPEVGLDEARERRDKARRLLRDGIDPCQKRKEEKQAQIERQTETKGLTVVKIKNTKPDPNRTIRLWDERGLYLEITPKGGTWWRFKYKFAGRGRLMSVGVYPEVSLKEARDRRDDARRLLRDGIDPGQHRKEKKQAQIEKQTEAGDTFEKAGREWIRKQMGDPKGTGDVGKGSVWTQDHAARVVRRIENDLFPSLGQRPIAKVTAPEVLATLRKIEARGVYHTVHRARSEAEAIFAMAIIEQKCTYNPAAGLEQALIAQPAPEHFPAITKPKEFGELLRAIHAYQGTGPVVRTALCLAPLFAVRPGELRKAKWAEVDFASATWSYVLTKTIKGGATDLLVPLSRQAFTLLKELHKFTGHGEYVFPTPRSVNRPMSDNGVLVALRTIGIPADVMSGHGFRASFRTMAAEQLKLPADLLEMQIGHLVRWPNGRAYDRTEFLPERRQIMQQWADYCDKLREQETVVVLKPAVA
jgi:integrase